MNLSIILDMTKEQISSLPRKVRWQLISELDQASTNLEETIKLLHEQPLTCVLLRHDLRRVKYQLALFHMSFHPTLYPNISTANQPTA